MSDSPEELEGQPVPDDVSGHELPGQLSDPIRAGEIPAPLKYVRPELPEEQPAPVDVAFGGGMGLGAGPTRKRDGTIPTKPAGTGRPRDNHIRAAAKLEQALAELRDAYRLASDKEFQAWAMVADVFGNDAGPRHLAWLKGRNSSVHAGDAERSRREIRDYLERL